MPGESSAGRPIDTMMDITGESKGRKEEVGSRIDRTESADAREYERKFENMGENLAAALKILVRMQGLVEFGKKVAEQAPNSRLRKEISENLQPLVDQVEHFVKTNEERRRESRGIETVDPYYSADAKSADYLTELMKKIYAAAKLEETLKRIDANVAEAREIVEDKKAGRPVREGAYFYAQRLLKDGNAEAEEQKAFVRQVNKELKEIGMDDIEKLREYFPEFKRETK